MRGKQGRISIVWNDFYLHFVEQSYIQMCTDIYEQKHHYSPS
jgi:hypothetical protein